MTYYTLSGCWNLITKVHIDSEQGYNIPKYAKIIKRHMAQIKTAE